MTDKFCKDCKYYSQYFEASCYRPQNGRDIVTGGIIPVNPTLDRNSNAENNCGLEAKFFVAEEKPKKCFLSEDMQFAIGIGAFFLVSFLLFKLV